MATAKGVGTPAVPVPLSDLPVLQHTPASFMFLTKRSNDFGMSAVLICTIVAADCYEHDH